MGSFWFWVFLGLGVSSGWVSNGFDISFSIGNDLTYLGWFRLVVATCMAVMLLLSLMML